jgi:hypothetical protein
LQLFTNSTFAIVTPVTEKEDPDNDIVGDRAVGAALRQKADLILTVPFGSVFSGKDENTPEASIIRVTRITNRRVISPCGRSANLADPDMIKFELAEDSKAALDQFAQIARDFSRQRHDGSIL